MQGEFEMHVTVRAAPAGEEIAGTVGLKFVHIVLDRGVTASQPMFTGSGRGELDDFRVQTEQWVRGLRAQGLDVIRVKIEAAPWSTGVPQHDDESANHPGRYFEHHVKLLLTDLEPTDVTEAHGARLSRNARRVRPDGRSERFLTQRCWSVGRATARGRLDRLLDALHDNSFEVVEVEEEYVVEDDNLDIDAGWLDPPRVP